MRARLILLAFLSATAAFLLMESAGRFAMDRIYHRGRLYRCHPEFGWTAIPGARVVRRNPEGEDWTVRTNEDGFRGPSVWPRSALKRVLVLGDSFAFGEGIDAQDRFDAVLTAARPGWACVDLGMAGYGTDQELIVGRTRFHGLRRGDYVVLQTYANDFQDIRRHSASLRAKPWFELQDGKLIQHWPEIGLLVKLRDRSYLLAAAGTALEAIRQKPRASASEREASFELYRRLILSAADELRPRGVKLLIALHGEKKLGGGVRYRERFRRLCATDGVGCLFLDEAIGEGCFFADGPGHWNKRGHRLVAQEILRLMEQPVRRDDKTPEMR